MTNNKQTILIVEDDTVQLQVLSEKISAAGFNVAQAIDGNVGLETALREQPALILLDNRMPNMSGYQMLKQLRDSGNWGAGVPVIFFSNVEPAGTEEREDIANITPTAYLLKSDTDLNSLIDKIKETLGVAQ